MMSVRHVVVVWCLAWSAASARDEVTVDEMQSSLVSQLVLSHQSEALQLLVNATETALRLLMKEISCPPPYTRVLDECFFVSKKKLSHSDARTHCQGMRGDLATPRNPYALVSYVYDRGVTFAWLGATDANSAEWRWFDGRLISADLWMRKPDMTEPSGKDDQGKAEDCCEMWADYHPPLNDAVCNDLKIFVCQFNQVK
nr:perlucin-like protein isoform X2 [Procambarus clarkii]